MFRMMKSLPILLAFSLAILAPISLGQGIDFERDIAPILEANCLSCHNASDAEGDFVLDSRISLMEHPDAIVPGNAPESDVLEVVTGPNPDMPEDGDPLSDAEVSLIERWIEEGAVWPDGLILRDKKPRDMDWWSLQPIKSKPIPESRFDHPVDAFVDARRAKKSLSLVPQANAVVLFRRLSYDLTGLPPDPEDVDAFVAAYEGAESDSSREAVWAEWVDRFISSAEFGGKWGQHWLDLARFAETHGYDKDKLRPNAWPYRDYVIRSFNSDKPVGRFAREQVAGDVLFPGEADGILGLGFLAAGPWDFIGHYEVGEAKLDGRIAKHLDRDEMISAVFNVFQSSTVQCAQCHNHKFDPIKMEDYYRLHAVFAGVDREDRVYEGLSPKQLEDRNAFIEQINGLRESS